MIDYEYMATMLANLSGLPVRLYENEKFQGLFHHSKFKPDLAILEETHIFANKDTVSYYMTDTFLFYGLFRMKENKTAFVIGPVAQIPLGKPAVRNILRSIGEPLSREHELKNYLESIPPYPLQQFLQILCIFDYFLNGEKRNAGDLLLPEILIPATSQQTQGEPLPEPTFIHNTYELEQQLISIVEHGRIEDLKELYVTPPIGRAGTLAQDALRQQKNLFICCTTLVTRAAIHGGLDREISFSLSDLYIQKVELLDCCSDVMDLQINMITEFTERVNDATCGEKANPQIRKIRTYILQHLSEKITTDRMAKLLGINRTYLNELFQRETNMSPSAYVMKLRLDEAKRLLAISKKPLQEIADHLGFSSQSHFQNTFRREFGITPTEYRTKEQIL